MDFLGRAAVEGARASGVARRLVSLVVSDPDPMLWGGDWAAAGHYAVDVGGDDVHPVRVGLRAPYDARACG